MVNKELAGSGTYCVPTNQWHHPATLTYWPGVPDYVNKGAGIAWHHWPNMATYGQWHWLNINIAIFGQLSHSEEPAPLFTFTGGPQVISVGSDQHWDSTFLHVWGKVWYVFLCMGFLHKIHARPEWFGMKFGGDPTPPFFPLDPLDMHTKPSSRIRIWYVFLGWTPQLKCFYFYFCACQICCSRL